MEANLPAFTLDELQSRCSDETARYLHRLPNDSQFCFELVRRALEEQISEAFTHIFLIYSPLCASWASNFSGFADTDEPSVDVFVNEGFARLYRDVRGEKFRNFTSLEAVLFYLKRCVITAILQALRKPRPLDLDEDLAEAFHAQIEYEQLWQRVCALLVDPHDQLLADLRFRQDMKPAEISAHHLELWPTARDVSVALQRINRVLRNDDLLRGMFGLGPTG